MSNKKRVIYESEDETDNVSYSNRLHNVNSQKKRVICDSDDDKDDTVAVKSVKDENKSIRQFGSEHTDISGKLTPSRRAHDYPSDDEWDPDTQRHVMEAIPTPQVTQPSSSGKDSLIFGYRRSQRSAAVMARSRLESMSENVSFPHRQRRESIDSLQSLSSRPHKPSRRRQGVIDNDGDDDDEDEDAPGDGSTSDDSDNDDDNTRRKSKQSSSKNTLRGNDSKSQNSRIGSGGKDSVRATRSSSGRNQKISAAKDAERETLQKEVQKFSARQSALDALSSDEEEGGEDEEYEEDEVTESSSKRRPTSSSKVSARGSVNRSPPSGTGSHRPRSQPSASCAFIRRETLPEKEDYSDDEGGVDDFIVGSDEEREEQQRELEAYALEKEKRHRKKEKERRLRAAEHEAERRRSEKLRLEREKSELERVKELHSETKCRRRRVIIVDDDDDNDNDAGVGGDVQLQWHESLSSKGVLAGRDAPKLPCVGHARSSGGGAEGETRVESSRRVETLESGEEEGKEMEEVEEENEEEDEEDDDDESLDGPMLYRRVDAMRDRDDEEEGSSFIPKVYSHSEALMLYVEMMAHTHRDPAFVTRCADVSLRRIGMKDTPSSSSRGPAPVSMARIKQYLAAARQIENLICTSRESLLASSAWKADFLLALKTRPFYCVTDLPSSCWDEKCDACNRSSHAVNKKVHLFGPSYDADRAWIRAQWDQELPPVLFLCPEDEEKRRDREQSGDRGRDGGSVDLSDSDDEQQARSRRRSKARTHTRAGKGGSADSESGDDEEDEDEEEDVAVIPWWQRKWHGSLVKEKESSWHLASHCRSRTQMYHTLLHYKARLFLKIRDKLRSCGTVDRMVSDVAYMTQEVDRFQALLKTAGDKWGGGKEMSDQAADLWLDNTVDLMGAQSSSQGTSGSIAETAGKVTSVLDWLATRERAK